MYPSIRPDEILSSALDEYLQHLGPHQADAFKWLWELDFSQDGWQEDLDGALSRIRWALSHNVTIRNLPRDLSDEIHAGLRTVEHRYPKTARTVDVEYFATLAAIADWQQDVVGGLANSFAEWLFI